MQTITLLSTLAGSAAVMAWRVRETRAPVTARKILIPPAGMSTGLLMFVAPPTRVPLAWSLSAFVAGALLFSYPLVRTSTLTRSGDDILLRRSRAFLWILLGLLAIRIGARDCVERYVDAVQTGSLFFLLAFGMLLPWRVAMYLRYRRLRAQPATGTP